MTVATQQRTRTRRAWRSGCWWTAGACALALSVLALWLWQRWGGAHTTRVVGYLGLLAFAVFATGCAIRAARTTRGRRRRSWLTLSVGLASWVLGDLLWGCRVLWLGLDQTPFPSVADAAFLLLPICAAGALLLFPTTEGGQSRTRMILDGVIVAGSLFVLSWVAVLDDAYAAGGGLLSIALSLGYPIAGVIVVTMAIVILARAPRADRLTLALITAGVTLMALADGAFAYLTAIGGYYNGHPVELGWMGAFALLGIAALHEGHPPTAETRAPRMVNAAWLWLPYLPVLIAGAVVAPRLVEGLDLGPSPFAALCVGMALLARQFIVLIEDRRLLMRASQGALHDPLTGLANRALFVDRLDQAVQRQRRELAPLAVLFLDVDGFKSINDSFGHSIGDQLLIRIAERLTGCLRATDTVARLGGDEFAVLVEGHVEDAVVAADRVSQAFTQPFIVDGAALTVRPSIGLTIATAEAADITTEGLLEKADLAMYAAKRDGGGCLRSFVPDVQFPDDLERLCHAEASNAAGLAQPVPIAHDEAARRAVDGPAPGGPMVAGGESWLLPAPATQPWIRGALGVLVAGLIAYAASILFRDEPGRITLFDGWLYTGITLLAAGLVAARALRVQAERWAWALIAVGMASSVLGNAVYALWVPDGESPSLADPLWLGFYPLVYAGLLLLVRARLRRSPTVIVLDGVAAGVTCAAASAAIASGPISAATTGSPATVFVGLAYPVGSLLLLALVGGMFALMGWRPEPRWLLLLTGFLLYAIADAAHLFETAEGTFVQGTWIDVLWGTQPVLAALASWAALDGHTPRPQRGLTVLAPPLVCSGVAIAVLGFDHNDPWAWVGQVLATLSLLTIAARFAVTFRQVSLLADSQHQAMTDDLTGLANRRAVATALTVASFEYVEQLGGGRAWAGPGLLLMDLDHFKQLDDALGRHAGDHVLCQVADRLSRSVRPDDLLARVGGDEFAVLLPAGTDLATAREQAAKLIDALRVPMHLEAMTVSVEASIGIVMCPEHCARPEQLLRCGYTTMCRAKSSPTKIAIYDVTADANWTDSGGVLHELRSAIAAGQLTCYYQPKIDARDGHLHSVEALARWNHPVRGLLLPDQFLAQAERAGLMRPLTTRVLDVALQQARRWRDRGTPLTIAVNLSVTNLLDVDLVADIDRLLHTYRLPPETLILEITESVFLNDATRSRSVVEALQRLGVGLSIDDYGTGWSSLAHLQELAVNELKLDQVFVARLRTDPRSVAIVRSTVALAHSLGASLVAEGVEDADTLNALREYGCDITQGYYHSPPLPADELDRWLDTQREGVKR